MSELMTPELMSQLQVLAICAGITSVMQLLGFAAAFALQTEKFYDVLGGLNALALVAYSLLSQAGDRPLSEDRHKMIASVIYVCSRGWLTLFLAWRAHERGGDARFDGVKDKFFQFLTFWAAQGIWVFSIALPVLFINGSMAARQDFATTDSVLAVGFAVGVALEVVADIQKASWVNAGRPGHFANLACGSFHGIQITSGRCCSGGAHGAWHMQAVLVPVTSCGGVAPRLLSSQC